ncbi:WEB family protein At1g12150-like [Rhododendron vialii]|uniref:WEB family protein At1g12150-like n=1 Tax=Rhododendron vialii TaxID=182163 RepID=UPI00265D73EE|nr:WEB family protein At1g12150-like [Rhododendron vialii]
MALLQNFKVIVHPAKASNIKKAMDVLVKSQDLETEETSLQYFQKEFLSMIKSHDSFTHELSKVNAKMVELEAVDVELTKFSAEWLQLKEDMQFNEASIMATSNEIADLKTKLAQAEGRLVELRNEATILAKQHDDMKAGSKSQKMKLNLLVEEMPNFRGQNEASIMATSNEIADLKTKLAQAEGRLVELRNEATILAKQHDDMKAGSKSQKMKLNLLVEEMPNFRGQNEASIMATSNEIADLKTKLAQAEGRLVELRNEATILAKQHDDMKAGSKSQKMKLNLLVEEMPNFRGQKEMVEAQLASFDTSWENLKNSLEGLL